MLQRQVGGLLLQKEGGGQVVAGGLLWRLRLVLGFLLRVKFCLAAKLLLTVKFFLLLAKQLLLRRSSARCSCCTLTDSRWLDSEEKKTPVLLISSCSVERGDFTAVRAAVCGSCSAACGGWTVGLGWVTGSG